MAKPVLYMKWWKLKTFLVLNEENIINIISLIIFHTYFIQYFSMSLINWSGDFNEYILKNAKKWTLE